MKHRGFRLRITIIAFLFLSEFSLAAGIEFSGNFGLSYIMEPEPGEFTYRTWSPRLGVESYYSLRDVLHLGAFYDQNFLSAERIGSAKLHFLGVIVRYRVSALPSDSNLFYYAKAGPTELITPDDSSGFKLGIEIGALYELPISSALALRGVFGYSILPCQLNSRAFQIIHPGLNLVIKI